MIESETRAERSLVSTSCTALGYSFRSGRSRTQLQLSEEKLRFPAGTRRSSRVVGRISPCRAHADPAGRALCCASFVRLQKMGCESTPCGHGLTCDAPKTMCQYPTDAGNIDRCNSVRPHKRSNHRAAEHKVVPPAEQLLIGRTHSSSSTSPPKMFVQLHT